ncbi:peptidylprolyl isomerase [Sphingomonas sp.]|uniref:peptidylprolyl isomerase n=1 Tax=Sphingomonas sp. TaxID=28214 RepID=UPI0025F4C48B|nr:peptidylprolyl isomerase [Sphingomonas sp.]
MKLKGAQPVSRMTAVLASGLLAVAAAAQTAPPATSDTGLNLPKDLTTFGKMDPHLRKATAIINGTIITGTDIDQRLALVVLANGGKIADEERERLRLQVLRNIIDETLQIQEAKAHDITVTQPEIDQSYARVAERFKRTPATMGAYLREQGSSERSIKRQIQGELAWSRLLRRRVEPFVNVSEDEVQSIMDRLQASKGQQEYHIGEIYLSATPQNSQEVLANGRKIIDQIRQGGSFAAYARQFSEASTAAVGGDLGWVRGPQLPEALSQTAAEIAVGQIAGPVAVPGGYSIVYMVDKRQVLMADPRDAVLNLRQMSLKFAPGASRAAVTAQAESFGKATQAMAGCGKTAEVAAAHGAEVVDNDQVKVRDLPPQLQEMLLKLSIGQATPPFGSPTEGVRVLVLCGRDEAASANAPTFDQVMSQIEENRVNQRAQRYLRDLRRDAVIDYR